MTERILRVNELIKDQLAKLVLKELEFPAGVLTTITRVECAANLFEARVYVSVWPTEKWGLASRILARKVFFLQKKLDKILKMRPVPKIVFVKETKVEEAARVEELLEKIRQKGK